MTLESLSIFDESLKQRRHVLRWVVLSCAVVAALWLGWSVYRGVHMPKHSYSGVAKPLSNDQLNLRDNLRRHVLKLASEIGERNVPRYQALVATSDYLRQELERYGYVVTPQAYVVDGREVLNLSVELRGSKRPGDLVVIGAHYDSVVGTPGANDNASGVAAVLEMARILKEKQFDRTVQFVFFTNEEPPYFQTDTMGSLVYARSLRKSNANVVGMIAVETIGSYFSAPGTQGYPAGLKTLYPDRGNFIAFVGDTYSAQLLKHAIGVFREHATIPSEGGAAPGDIPGVGWSDHWSFWQQGYPAIMVTDTAPFRYRYYHTALDTPEKVDYENVTRVVTGLIHVVENLATTDR